MKRMNMLARSGGVVIVSAGLLYAATQPSFASNDWSGVGLVTYQQICSYNSIKMHESTNRAYAKVRVCWHGSDVAIRARATDKKGDRYGAVAEIRYQIDTGTHWVTKKRHVIIDRHGKGTSVLSKRYQGNYPTRNVQVRAESVTRHGHYFDPSRWSVQV